MQRRNMQLNALRAFESTARHGSLTDAARELGVTHAAVSHQIKNLEDILGMDLFIRTSRGVLLTAEGRRLLPVLSDSFDRIGQVLDSLTSIKATRLIVTTTPTFASRWLIPRLSRWKRIAPEVEVHVLPTLELLNLEGRDVDVAIRCGIPNWPGEIISEKLMAVTMTPVCSPFYIEHNPIPDLSTDLAAHTLIHADVEMADAGYEWRAWFNASGATVSSEASGVSFHDPGLAMEAAVSGVGIAMGYVELIQSDIDAGRLICPFDVTAVHPYSYFFLYNRNRVDEPSIAAFRDWIYSEASAEVITEPMLQS